MAFVKEEISERDLNLFNSWRLRDYKGNVITASKKDCWWWIADKESDIYLVNLFGDRLSYIPYTYAFIWRQNIITLEKELLVRNAELIKYKLKNIKMSMNLKDKKNEILEDLKAAFIENSTNRRLVGRNKKIEVIIEEPIHFYPTELK